MKKRGVGINIRETTKSQRGILAMFERGMSAPEIAAHLGISLDAVIAAIGRPDKKIR
jgi:DNA-binding CsgD family transcriptional regulator